MSSQRLMPLYALVFTVGMASLGTEIAAARLIAPFFGASTVVWANTIGVVLVSLSVGYWYGGRFADRHPARRGLSLLSLVAALLIGMVPFVAAPFLEVSVDALEELSAGAFVGSLLAVSVLIALPVLLLGAAAPYAIRLATERVERSGTVAGRMYAISTAGSLLGTFVSALVLIPLVGTRRTFLAFALALALTTLPSLGRRYIVAPLALAAAMALPIGLVKASAEGKVIFETETPYQYVRVVQTSDARYLELNEGQAVHSLYRFGSYLTDNVWDAYLVLPFAALDRAPRRVAILGNAAGTTARAYGHFFPETAVDGVEIDGKLTAVGRRYFDLRNHKLRVFHEDARPYLHRVDRKYDLIMVDAYRQPYIPFYLTTKEFFSLARDRLTRGGAVLINVGHPRGENELERVLGATLRAVFTTVLREPAEATNTVLLATDGPAGGAALRSKIGFLPPGLRSLARITAAKIAAPLAGGEIYSDDRAPVEWLIDKSIVRYAARK